MELVVDGLVTPPSERGTGDVVTVSTKHSDGGLIDGPASLAMDAITAGELKGHLTWKPAIDTPGVRTSVTVSLTLTGRINASGTMMLVLPHAYECTSVGLDDVERTSSSADVTVLSPAGITATSSWSSGSDGTHGTVRVDFLVDVAEGSEMELVPHLLTT